jgi:hypothetical protein
MALKVNVWIEIRDTFAFPAEDPELDNELQAKNRETLSRAADITVVPYLFKQRTQGPRSYQLFSLLYKVETNQELEQAVERFQSENPGETNVMGAWHWEYGNQFGTEPVITEVPNPAYTGEPFYIPNPDYQPDPELPDYDPREELRNPLYVPEFFTEITQTGVPLYPIPGSLSNFMPDEGDPPVPNPTVRDINIFAGQALRIF